jgi:hypothetical protein
VPCDRARGALSQNFDPLSCAKLEPLVVSFLPQPQYEWVTHIFLPKFMVKPHLFLVTDSILNLYTICVLVCSKFTGCCAREDSVEVHFVKMIPYRCDQHIKLKAIAIVTCRRNKVDCAKVLRQAMELARGLSSYKWSFQPQHHGRGSQESTLPQLASV